MRDPMRTQAIPIPPEAVWAALPPALRRRIAAQMAAILAEETPHEVRTGHARASRAALAVVYVRQSTPAQVVSNQESLRLQYALTGRARDLGWRAADIDVIDADLGQSGASLMGRDGFKDLAARVGLGEIGIVLSIDVTRLARNCSDWYPLLDVCALRGCLIADRDGLSRSRLGERAAAFGAQGLDLGARAAHDQIAPDGGASGQGAARGVGADPAGGARADARRRGRPRSRPGGARADEAGLPDLRAPPERGGGDARPVRPGPRPASSGQARRSALDAAHRLGPHDDPERGPPMPARTPPDASA